jgi:hypothetical protein
MQRVQAWAQANVRTNWLDSADRAGDEADAHWIAVPLTLVRGHCGEDREDDPKNEQDREQQQPDEDQRERDCNDVSDQQRDLEVEGFGGVMTDERVFFAIDEVDHEWRNETGDDSECLSENSHCLGIGAGTAWSGGGGGLPPMLDRPTSGKRPTCPGNSPERDLRSALELS